MYAGSDTTDIAVPAELGYVRVLRLATAGALSLFEFDHVFIEDVKAAVGEAAALVLGSNGAPGRLQLTMHCSDDVADITVRGHFAAEPERVTNEDDLAEVLLSQIVDRFDIDEARRSVSFKMWS